MGRFDEAISEAKRAQGVDPLSSTMNTSAGWIFYFARNYDEAIKRYREVIEIYPDSFEPHRRLGLAYLQKKMNAEAIAEIQQSRALSGENAEEIAYLGYVYGVTGKRAEAQKVLDQLQGQSKRRYVSPYLIALIYAGLSNKDQAFTWLEKAYEDRSVNLVFLKVEPILDPLRSDPRFADLLQRMNLTP
jgi:tetratricopeptide (TPR) repeat protein